MSTSRSSRRNRYTFFNFLVDCVMIVCTGGLWFFWIWMRGSKNGHR